MKYSKNIYIYIYDRYISQRHRKGLPLAKSGTV